MALVAPKNTEIADKMAATQLFNPTRLIQWSSGVKPVSSGMTFLRSEIFGDENHADRNQKIAARMPVTSEPAARYTTAHRIYIPPRL
jgi:hypothetical protein